MWAQYLKFLSLKLNTTFSTTKKYSLQALNAVLNRLKEINKINFKVHVYEVSENILSLSLLFIFLFRIHWT